MHADEVLTHVGLELLLKNRVDELLLFSEDIAVLGRGTVRWVEDFLTVVGTSSGEGGTTPAIPLFCVLEDSIVGLVTFDTTFEVVNGGCGSSGQPGREDGGCNWLVGVVGVESVVIITLSV